MKNNIFATNIAFIILISLLCVASLKGQNKTFEATKTLSFGGINNFSKTETLSSKEVEPQIVLRDFDTIQQPKKVKKTIDKATAMNYIKSRSLNGTEMLALGKIKKFSPYLNKNKKIVIYVNKGSQREIQAFIKEFSKTKEKLSNNPKFVFIPLENLWNIEEENIRNSHDRVVYNLKQDCGLFCVIDLGAGKLIRMKGSGVSKKSAEIMGVILNSL